MAEDDTLAVLDSAVDGVSGEDRWERHFIPVEGTAELNYSHVTGTAAETVSEETHDGDLKVERERRREREKERERALVVYTEKKKKLKYAQFF